MSSVCLLLPLAGCSGEVAGGEDDPLAGGMPSGAPVLGPDGVPVEGTTPGAPVPPGVQPPPGSPVGTPAVDPVTGMPVDGMAPAGTPPPGATGPGPTPTTPGVVEMPPVEDDDAAALAACASATSVNVGLSKLRRLTRPQLSNTLRDLLQVDGSVVERLVEDEHMGPFFSNAVAPPDNLIVQQHQEIAALVAAEVAPRMAELSPCDLAAGDAACTQEFVETLGLQAYRRPLQSAEVEELVELFNLGSSSGGAQNGFRLTVEAMLQAPSFLYHADTGADGLPSSAPVTVSPYVLASRLSYFLWDSMPDDELFALAADGTLSQDTVLAAQVERLLADDKAAATIGQFYTQLLGLGEITNPQNAKDTEVFPDFTPALADAMLEETALFAQKVVLEGDGLYRTLLTAEYSYPSEQLFDLYGVESPDGFSPGSQVNMDGTQRAGFLTQGAFLTAHAKRNATSPVHRGIVIRENLLCQTIQPPPDGVVTVLPEATPFTTTRERFDVHLEDPACALCHTLMDPLGFAFENYDGIGEYRTLEGEVTIDASGTLIGTGEATPPAFTNALELTNLLANSNVAADCMATQWLRYSLGRVESQDDACSVAAVHTGFTNSGGNVLELLKQITLSEAFRYVRSTASEEL